ncbi:hypothetical protein ACFO25_09980 [Paenactinomyces guangxiensis]|uniref:Uncharacterized protein n=1 Tax=Paenactinomyces guangxiensis TaxID=1490290 RepID=A0A7W1WS86_9BACL|nr:hypothetical protein [Paenactinomyces guangxiensis]MBA4495113.1 hypothetical protein [Paenactinomyces guangxiensis]MBH8592203.1 hypothetical protein [Paenactinomyces guangxiensis]
MKVNIYILFNKATEKFLTRGFNQSLYVFRTRGRAEGFIKAQRYDPEKVVIVELSGEVKGVGGNGT